MIKRKIFLLYFRLPGPYGGEGVARPFGSGPWARLLSNILLFNLENYIFAKL
jgi:hypothetical protein